MAEIPDTGDSVFRVVNTALQQRCGREPDLVLSGAEIRPSHADRELTCRLIALWKGR